MLQLMDKWSTLGGGFLLACSLATWGSTANAEAPSPVDVGIPTPQSVPSADPAQIAFESGRWQAAIALYETLPLHTRTASQQINLARARTKRGLWLEALDAYEHLLAPQSPHLAPSGWQEVRTLAELEGAELGQALPWASLNFGSTVPSGSSVFIDGHWVAPGRFKEAYPVNPGWHTFLLEVDGKVQAARRMYFERGQKRDVRLVHFDPVAPSLTSPLIPPLPSAPPVELDGHPPRPSDPQRETSGSPFLRTTTYLAIGISTAGWIASAAFAYDASRKRRSADRDGLGLDWDRQAYDNYQRSRTRSVNAAYVGVAGAVSSGLLWWWSRSQQQATETPTAVSLAGYVGFDSAGLSGRF